MNENNAERLRSDLEVSMMFLKAIEESKQLEAEREERIKRKAAEATEKRRRETELEECYREYRRNNPPTALEREQARRGFFDTLRECTGIDYEERIRNSRR